MASAQFSACADERIYAVGGDSQNFLMAVGPETSYSFYLATMNLNQSVPAQIMAVTDSASFTVGPLAPLQLITIFGKGLGPKAGIAATPTGGSFPTKLGGTSVLIEGVSAAILYASDTVVNAVVPNMSGEGINYLEIIAAAGTSELIATWVINCAPTIFSQDGSGVGPGAISNQDGTLNSPANPAARGSTISVYGTGGGKTNPSTLEGQIVTSAAPLVVAPYLYAGFGTEFVPVAYAGAAPGLVNGALQVNVIVPTNIQPGSRVPIYLQCSPYLSQGGITVSVN